MLSSQFTIDKNYAMKLYRMSFVTGIALSVDVNQVQLDRQGTTWHEENGAVNSDASHTDPNLSSTLNFNFGDYVMDFCDDPVMTLTNQVYSNNAPQPRSRIPPRNPDGTCSDDMLCIGDCVAVIVTYAGGEEDRFESSSRPINVVAGMDLPNPGTCSDEAVDRNYPPGSWDFSSVGSCGKGIDGHGYWKNCLVHDVCVWARCHDNGLVPGGIGLLGRGGGESDAFCGLAFQHAKWDWLYSHSLLPECWFDSSYCVSPLTCWLGLCIRRRKGGSYCINDENCEGYCHFFKCYDILEGQCSGE